MSFSARRYKLGGKLPELPATQLLEPQGEHLDACEHQPRAQKNLPYYFYFNHLDEVAFNSPRCACAEVLPHRHIYKFPQFCELWKGHLIWAVSLRILRNGQTGMSNLH